MMYFWPACPSSQKSKVFEGFIIPARNSGDCTVTVGTMKSVMLWGGREFEIEFPESGTSLKRVMTFAEVSCHTCAVLPGTRLVRLMVGNIGVVSCLLITMSVSAPSLA